MRKPKDFNIRKVSRVGNGLGVFLTSEIKNLGWSTETYVIIRTEDNTITIKKMDIPKK